QSLHCTFRPLPLNTLFPYTTLFRSAMTLDTTSVNSRNTTDEEVDEWLESWEGLVCARGTLRAGEIMEALRRRAATNSVAQPKVTTTDYVNTIPADQEPAYPGDERIE